MAVVLLAFVVQIMPVQTACSADVRGCVVKGLTRTTANLTLLPGKVINKIWNYLLEPFSYFRGYRRAIRAFDVRKFVELRKKVRLFIEKEGLEKLDDVALREYQSLEGKVAILEEVVRYNGGPYSEVRKMLLSGSLIQKKKAYSIIRSFEYSKNKLPRIEETKDLFERVYILAYGDARSIENLAARGFKVSRDALFRQRVAAEFLTEDLYGTLKKLGLVSESVERELIKKKNRVFSFLLKQLANAGSVYLYKIPFFYPEVSFLKGKVLSEAIKKEVLENGFSAKFYQLMKESFGKTAGFELFLHELTRLEVNLTVYIFHEDLSDLVKTLFVDLIWDRGIDYHFLGGKEEEERLRKEQQEALQNTVDDVISKPIQVTTPEDILEIFSGIAEEENKSK